MNTRPSLFTRVASALGFAALLLAGHIARGQPNTFQETKLISDIPGEAALTDSNLVNPWGITSSASSPFWFSDNGTGVSTLYNSTTHTEPSLVVSIPAPAGGTGAPTGAAFNGTTAFNGDTFVFDTEDGTINGWRGALGTTAESLADNSGAGAVYKGLAVSHIGSNSYLYATDFHNNQITVLPSTGAPALSGNFVDPNLPAGFAPFNIENISGQLFVTYAKQDAAGHDDVSGAGNGYVDIFDLNGDLLKRLISGGPLNSPWGLALAPTGFGPFGGDLLVGNFGDGSINAFDPTSGAFIDSLKDPGNNPIDIQGLWGLTFGNGGSGGLKSDLYFTAGIPGNDEVEDHGLFGSLTHVPDGGTTLLLLAGSLAALFGFYRLGAASRRTEAVRA